jgi:hypothetical protein
LLNNEALLSHLYRTYNLDLLFDLIEVYALRKSKKMLYDQIFNEIFTIKSRIDQLDPALFEIENTLERYNIKIETVSDKTIAKLYHSLYIDHSLEKKIVVYDEWIQPVSVDELHLSLLKDQVLNLHLAHECYHVLENYQPEQITALYPKPLFHAVSEIGAHHFAKKCTGIQVHPRLIGSIIAIQNQWLDINDFEQKICNQVQFLIKKGVSKNDIFI